jgi:hypothetical protein
MLVNGILLRADSKKVALSFVSNKFFGSFEICKCLCFCVLLWVNGIWIELQALLVTTIRHLLASQGPVGSFVLPGLSIHTKLKILGSRSGFDEYLKNLGYYDVPNGKQFLVNGKSLPPNTT